LSFIHAPAFAYQQHRQPAISEPPADGRQLAQPLVKRVLPIALAAGTQLSDGGKMRKY
jgi:hypothetical protein